MTLVWDASFPTPTAKLIALKLADCANDDGANVFPSRRTVERATMCSPAAVKKWLAAFEQAGLLIVERRSLGGTQKDTTVRRFNMPLLRALASGTKKLDRSGPLIVIVDAAAGHVVAGPWEDPAITHPSPGHLIADTGPPNGPKPSMNHESTVTPPQSPARRGKRGRVDEIDVVLDAVRRAFENNPQALALIDDLLAPIAQPRQIDAPSVQGALKHLVADLLKSGLSKDECAAVVARLLAKRKVTVRPSDITDEVKAQVGQRPGKPALTADPAFAAGWPAAMDVLRGMIGTVHFDSYCPTLVPFAVSGSRLTVATHMKFIAQHIEQQYAVPLRVAVQSQWPHIDAVIVEARKPAKKEAA